MTAFTIENLNLAYGEHVALKNINLLIPKQQITAFIGPSGCGKSTLMKTLNRMNDFVPSCTITGSVLLEGEDIYQMKDVDNLRKKVGMVFQKANAFQMSIFDNIAYGIKTHESLNRDEMKQRVEEALRQAVLWDEVKDRLHKSALSLSGGQQQRLCIARALAVKPDILLMDESTSSLDPISTAKIEELAMTLKARYTIVMVTHNMQQAARVSDQTAFFLNGKLIECQPTAQLFSLPEQEETANYISGRFG
ncbi:phosphate ABC transporter ATP-binding protein PstB [Enterococcus timonensis]|uniref:phosphate ABC transporter ATP-binding protein PstB n=1 Tax=Enterococcus timonensis TaxID=1852364 RepID=UPI0008D9B8E6|nr:phosphate ABC transporter ATP-binding protein PstB [Enterococcus timonensis]